MNTPLISVNGGPLKPMKLPRALPHVWKRFWSLESHESFFFRGSQYLVSLFPVCFAFKIQVQPIRYEFFWPWTRVRTNVLIRDSRPGGKSSEDIIKELSSRPRKTLPPEFLKEHGFDRPYTREELEGTPFTGDDLTRLPQPHSDNPVSGPTS